MLRKPTPGETGYFAVEDAVKRRRLARRFAAEAYAEARARAREAHWMRCPRCGGTLLKGTVAGIEVDRCASCEVVCLEARRLAALVPAKSKRRGELTRAIARLVTPRFE